MTEYEAVVIGAGNGGLTAALGLARSGVKTLLLERHNVPGGCATSFVRGRFEFEVALHQLSGMGTESFPGPLRDMLTRLEILDRLEFVQMPNLYRLVIPGRLDITLKADRVAAVDSPESAVSFRDGGHRPVFRSGVRLLRAMGRGDHFPGPRKPPRRNTRPFLNTRSNPYRPSWMTFSRTPSLKQPWGSTGLTRECLLPGSHYGDFAIVLWAYIEFKPFHIKGGSQALSNTLLDAYLQAGGDVRFNCGAREILVADGRTTGVVTEAGDRIDTGHVVSNASTLTTYVDLIDKAHIPQDRLRELGARTVGTSFVNVFLGFDCDPADLGITEATNFLATNSDIEDVYRKTQTLSAPEAMLFTCYDVDDPDFSPPGACQATLVGLAYAEPWLSVPPHQYFDTKNRVAGQMLETLYRVFPKCRDHIEELEVGTPVTHMRYLGHPGGAAYGFDQHAKDTEFFLDRKSPLKGLFHVGAWSGMGGFQPTLMSGFSTSRAVVRSLQK